MSVATTDADDSTRRILALKPSPTTFNDTAARRDLRENRNG